MDLVLLSEDGLAELLQTFACFKRREQNFKKAVWGEYFWEEIFFLSQTTSYILEEQYCYVYQVSS